MLDFNREIQELEQGKTYKYLGTEKSEGIQHQQMKERLRKEYTRRLRMIMKSEFFYYFLLLFFFNYYYWQLEYNVFHKLMCWQESSLWTF
jgi:hypothetical protein